MKIKSSKRISLCITLLIFLYFQVAAVSAVDVYPGKSVEIGGSCTSDYVFLFVTGPNLPSNGANPEDINEEVITGDSSSFVTVSAFNNRWSYKWDTRTSEANPDAGTYTFYAVGRPVGRNDLAGEEYSTKTVRLLGPSISVSGTSSSKESMEYSISSVNREETGSVTESETEEVTIVPTTVPPTEDITESVAVTETPATGIPAVLLILSIVVSFVFVLVRGNKCG